jgi:hypothetical protein
MVTFLKTFAVNDGVTGSEALPGSEDLYITPAELFNAFGCSATEEEIRFVMSLINTHCGRTSLWPTEIEETRRIPHDRQETRLTVTPVIKLLDLAGRYSYGRRDRQSWNNMNQGYAGILAMTAAARPQWSPINPDFCELQPENGILYLPWSMLIFPFSTVRCRYSAGFIEIPARVKAAVAELLNSIKARGISDRVRYNVGRVSRTFSSDTFVTKQAEQLLAPFVVSAFE